MPSWLLPAVMGPAAAGYRATCKMASHPILRPLKMVLTN